jgi:hypothetical protein
MQSDVGPPLGLSSIGSATEDWRAVFPMNCGEEMGSCC